MDAKDILGLPKTSLSITQEKKSRPQKDSQRKPDGISREVKFTLCRSRVLLLKVTYNLVNLGFLRNCRFTHSQVGWHLSCQRSMSLSWNVGLQQRTRRLVLILNDLISVLAICKLEYLTHSTLGELNFGRSLSSHLHCLIFLFSCKKFSLCLFGSRINYRKSGLHELL